ncbi:hypothetical protein C7T94_15820 [Pedobacter yulinensis]|uniref:DUF6089 domain-containing protein n=1 Tax=Pedobacter yulinensis TaxID=2126353 RepID=A0A2T3HIJ5_9SPHI|nr:DUF6089 family protein [Pedobacter yulinensis]PST82259.1 hypothetical protein C7T94_15820 [Pedobacter yulinensis]
MTGTRSVFVLLVLCLFPGGVVCAQQPFPDTVWELGLSGGAAGYMGDLNPSNPFRISGPSAAVYGKIHFDAHFGLRGQYSYGSISARDSRSSNAQIRKRNLSFKSPLHEAALLLDFNFMDYFSGGGRQFMTPYLFAGVAATAFEPSAKYQGSTYRLAEYRTEGQDVPYNRIVVSIPYGAGFRYNFRGNWSVFSEIGYRTSTSDYLDDVSGTYTRFPDQVAPLRRALADRSAELAGGTWNAAGSQRGDFRKRDTYMFVGIGISFTFVPQNCYRF